MEESAQILEIETFIPLLLQNPEDSYNRLKRWIMIGDHHQLPPVIKNMAFQKFSNMEQSLFTRFVRLGVPTVDLDAQGRARARYVVVNLKIILFLFFLSFFVKDSTGMGIWKEEFSFFTKLCWSHPVFFILWEGWKFDEMLDVDEYM